MQTLFNLVLPPHIFAGVVSLILFWIPVFSKKGGRLHVMAGRWYVRMMWLVLFSSIALCIIRFFQGFYDAALFLGFIALISAQPLWYGIAVTRSKRAITPNMIKTRKNLLLTLFLYGLIISIFALFWGSGMFKTLSLIFGIIGMISGRKYFWSDEAFQSKYHWLVDHMDGMLVSGIAAYTAFFAFGGRAFLANYLVDQWQIVPWVLPTLVGTIAIRIMKKKILARG